MDSIDPLMSYSSFVFENALSKSSLRFVSFWTVEKDFSKHL